MMSQFSYPGLRDCYRGLAQPGVEKYSQMIGSLNLLEKAQLSISFGGLGTLLLGLPGEDCLARSSRDVSSKDDRLAISAMCSLEMGTRSLVAMMAWDASLNMKATNRAVGQSQMKRLRLLHRFHSMIREDLVVATVASSVVQMVKQANRANI